MAATWYWIASPNLGWTTPSAAQIVAGQDGSGAAATAAGSFADSGQTSPMDAPDAASGLSPSTNYKFAGCWYDGTTYSNVVESGSWSTLAASVDAVLSEAAATDDAVVCAVVGALALAENVAASDSSTTGGIASAALAESPTATDAYAIASSSVSALGEAVASAESLSYVLTTGATASEALSCADAQTGAAVSSAALTDAASLTESTTWGSAPISASLAEAVAPSDSYLGISAAVMAAAEALALADAAAAAASAQAQLSEGAFAGDAAAWGSIYSSVMTDAASALEALAGVVIAAPGARSPKARFTTPLSFVPPRIPIADPATGSITREWYMFLRGIFDRVGGSDGMTTMDIALSMADDAGIEEVKAGLYSYMQDCGQAPVAPALTEQADPLQVAVAALEAQVAELTKAVHDLRQGPIN